MTEVPDDPGELGPAMEALSPKRRAFVRAVVKLGHQGISNYAEAARIAGYSDKSDGAAVIAHRLTHDAAIQAALLEEARRTINLAASVVATPVVISIAMDPAIKPKDRLSACEMLFNRGGMPAMTEHKVTVEHKQPKQMVELAARLAAELGIDQAKLIGINRAAAPVLEGEYVEVPVERTPD